MSVPVKLASSEANSGFMQCIEQRGQQPREQCLSHMKRSNLTIGFTDGSRQRFCMNVHSGSPNKRYRNDKTDTVANTTTAHAVAQSRWTEKTLSRVQRASRMPASMPANLPTAASRNLDNGDKS